MNDGPSVKIHGTVTEHTMTPRRTQRVDEFPINTRVSTPDGGNILLPGEWFTVGCPVSITVASERDATILDRDATSGHDSR